MSADARAPGAESVWRGVLAGLLLGTGLLLVPLPARAQEDRLLRTYAEFVRDNPGHVETRLRYARALMARGMEREATEQFERVLEDRPRDTEVLLQLAELYGWHGRSADRLHVHERLRTVAPHLVDVRLALARAYLASGRSGEGITELEAVLEARPGDVEVRRELANQYMWNGRTDEGIVQLEALLERTPDDLGLRRELARHYLWSDRVAEGVAQLELLVERVPDDAALRRELANQHLWNGRTAEGIAQLEVLVAGAPADTALRRELADQYLWNDRTGEGIRELEVLREARPDDTALRRELANLYLWNGREAEARAELRLLVESTPDDLELRDELAALLVAADRPSEAVAHLERLLAADPEALPLRLRLAQALAWSDRAGEALHHLDRILAHEPDHAEALLLAGEIRRWRAEEWYEGKEHLQRLLELHPEEDRARALLSGLRGERGPRVQSEVRGISDSNGLSIYEVPVEAGLWMTGRWRLGVVGRHRTLVDAPELPRPGSGRRTGYEAAVQASRAFPGAATVEAELGVTVLPSGRAPLVGALSVRTPILPGGSVALGVHRRPVLGSAPSLDRGILVRRLTAEAYARPFERLELWATGGHASYSDGNRGVAGSGGGRLFARLGEPGIALYGRYGYEDTHRLLPDSRPYWTPDELSTVAAGIELEQEVAGWLEARLRYGLTRQEATSHEYGVELRARVSAVHLLDAGMQRQGSDVYSATAFFVRYAHRLRFP